MSAAPSSSRWPEWLGPVYRLSNPRLEVVVAPRLGRVVAVARPGEPNWLAEPESPLPLEAVWPSYPGDKLWPAAQFLWPQYQGVAAPDPVFDKASWEVTEADETGLTLVSAVSPGLGLRAERRLRLAPDAPGLTQDWVLRRVAPSGFPVCAWTVTTCRLADEIFLDYSVARARPGPRPYHNFLNPREALPNVRELGTPPVLVFGHPAAGASKAGTYGRWIALRRGSSLFRQTVAGDPLGCFLEESNLQAWSYPPSGWCEIETSSPHLHLRPGETLSWRVEWDFLDLPPGALSPEAVAVFLAAQSPDRP